jgi:hypothetical protein
MRRLTIRVAALAVAALPLACAHPPPPQPQMSQSMQMSVAQACAADIDRLCPGVPPGNGRIKACMRANIAQLSPGCFDAVLGAVASEREPN